MKKVNTPKHIQNGQKVGLRVGQNGECFIKVIVTNETEKLSREIEFLIDTGFNGYIQLNRSTVQELKLTITGKGISTGYDGVQKEVEVVSTKVKILDMEISGFPIQVVDNGTFLIGTRFLKDTGRMLVIDYPQERLTLSGNHKVQNKVEKTIDKYASR